MKKYSQRKKKREKKKVGEEDRLRIENQKQVRDRSEIQEGENRSKIFKLNEQGEGRQVKQETDRPDSKKQ